MKTQTHLNVLLIVIPLAPQVNVKPSIINALNVLPVCGISVHQVFHLSHVQNIAHMELTEEQRKWSAFLAMVQFQMNHKKDKSIVQVTKDLIRVLFEKFTIIPEKK